MINSSLNVFFTSYVLPLSRTSLHIILGLTSKTVLHFITEIDVLVSGVPGVAARLTAMACV